MKNPYVSLLKIAWRFVQEKRWQMVLVYAMFIVANGFLMIQPYVLSRLLNALQQGGPDLLKTASLYLLLYPLLAFLFWVFHGNARVIERKLSFHIFKNFNEHLFESIARLPLQWHKDHHSGEVMSRVKKASAAVQKFTDESFIYIETTVRFFLSLMAIFLIVPRFGFLAVGMGALIVFTIFRFDRVLVLALKKLNARFHTFDASFYDYVSNITTVITLRLEALARNEIVRKLQRIFPVFRKQIVVNEVKWFSISMGLEFMSFLILFSYLYSELMSPEVFLVGTFVALYQYVREFMDVFYRVAWQYEQLVWLNTDLESIAFIPKAYQNVHPRVLALPSDWSVVHIRNLNFRYRDEKHRPQHLKKVNVDLVRGAKIALVGESGSGKSTLMTLLRGLHDADRVKVVVDGKNDGKNREQNFLFPTLKVLSDYVTLIPQTPEIFDQTVEYNITAGIHHSKQELLDACRFARFDSVLERLPNGFKTHVKEKGVNLSGGEKQRLALARGFFAAKNSQIILLDEPTSSVDTRNEMAIYSHLFKEFPDRCIVSSIHRLHLLKRFDRIYVFDEGEIVEEGNFLELISRNGLLKKLYQLYEKGEFVLAEADRIS